MRVDREWLVVGVLLAAVLVGAVHLHGERRAPADAPEDRLVTVGANGTELWPHTSRSPSFAGRTLALNVVVDGGPERTQRLMTRRTDANWSRVDREEADVAPESVSVADEGPVWADARGSARYTHVQRADGRSGWLRERYQLQVGRYLGERRHVRAYALEDENWTAMQAHAEHWDWFRLRHTVDDVAGPGEFVATDLASGGGDRRETGWNDRAVVVELLLAPLAALAVGRVDRDRLRAALPLPVALVALVVGVRLVGVAVEGAMPALDPKVVAGALYPVLVGGVPLAAFGLSRRLSPRLAFLLAATGIWTGFLVDYLFLGVGFVRPPELLHRVGIGLAVGLLAAAGGLDPARRPGPLFAGLGGWLLALLLPLLGLL